MKTTGLLAIGVGAFAIWYMTRASGPKWPAGTNLGYGITVMGATQNIVTKQWMYMLQYAEGVTDGPFTQSEVEAILALY